MGENQDLDQRDRLKLEDIKEQLRDMAYYPVHGERYSVLKFYFADAFLHNSSSK